MPINWLLVETIDIYESPINIILFLMNPLVQTSNHSPKILTEICMKVGIMVISHQTKKWVTPLLLFEFKTQQQP